jgi:hypothetical protein
MKTLPELREEQLNERFLRKGAGIMFASQSKSHGDKAERHLETAKQHLHKRPNQSLEERVENIEKSLQSLADGLISMRNQNGAITSLCLTAVLLNEKGKGRR